ncbi:cilia- and flagella-associated protein 100 [Cebidichthys violaceus]|uniref:cilia- and flagella-associated protein 100 n=1 Tax=Cebidichthys violaceus TaxID=271503 RepID=UPI0035CC2102
MLSPHPKGPAISSGSNVVSETDSAAKSPKPDMRRETRQSPFRVPDSNSIFQLSANERGGRKEEMRKFLALPIEEKTTHNARKMARVRKLLGEQKEEEEEMKEMKNLKLTKSRTALPEQTAIRQELKRAMMKRENFTKESKHHFRSMERQKAVLELNLMEKRSEISGMDKAITEEEESLRQLEELIERDNLLFEDFLRENEKKSVEARTFLEREAKSNQEKKAEIKKLTAEIGTVTSELAKSQEILTDYKSYKELLFKLSPPEWQEAQKTKAVKGPSDGDAEDKRDKGPEESANNNDLESEVSDPAGEPPSIRETRLSSARGDTLSTITKLNSDNSEYEDEPELFFTDPQQLLDLVTDLTEKNLSLIQNTSRVEETAKELRNTMKTISTKFKSTDVSLDLQLKNMSERVDREKARGKKLKQMVEFHLSLDTEDQDAMWDALGRKVSEVYRNCVDDRITNLSTLEKLAKIENRMGLLLEGLESLPEESLEMMKKIKDSERRSRQREEKLREQREKQKDRMRRYLERSLADSKKISGRKLMPRCKPDAQKVRVRNVDTTPTEDEMYSDLFIPDDVE